MNFECRVCLSILKNPCCFKSSDEFRLRALSFSRITCAAKELKVILVVGAALRLWYDVVNRHIPKRELSPASVT